MSDQLISLVDLAAQVNRQPVTLQALRRRGIFDAIAMGRNGTKRPKYFVDPVNVDKLMKFLEKRGRKPIEPPKLTGTCTQCGKPLEFNGLCPKCYRERQAAKAAGVAR